jgi:hypothetical protein
MGPRFVGAQPDGGLGFARRLVELLRFEQAEREQDVRIGILRLGQQHLPQPPLGFVVTPHVHEHGGAVEVRVDHECFIY